jgi:hypothetical protein
MRRAHEYSTTPARSSRGLTSRRHCQKRVQHALVAEEDEEALKPDQTTVCTVRVRACTIPVDSTRGRADSERTGVVFLSRVR